MEFFYLCGFVVSYFIYFKEIGQYMKIGYFMNV